MLQHLQFTSSFGVHVSKPVASAKTAGGAVLFAPERAVGFAAGRTVWFAAKEVIDASRLTAGPVSSRDTRAT